MNNMESKRLKRRGKKANSISDKILSATYLIFIVILLTLIQRQIHLLDQMTKHHGSAHRYPVRDDIKLHTFQQHEPYVDVLSIASIARPQLVQAQKGTWGSHKVVRNFITATEKDDPDPLCSRKFTPKEVQSYSVGCKMKKSGKTWPHVSRKVVTDFFINQFARKNWLAKKADAGAWLCAQRRVGAALAKVGRSYRTNMKMRELPEFLIVTDDDTYINMDRFKEEILLQQGNNTLGELYHADADRSAKVYAGCIIVAAPANQYQFTFPFGGWGTFFSKGAIKRLITPLHCKNYNDTTKDTSSSLSSFRRWACHRLTGGNLTLRQKQSADDQRFDVLGESRLFQDGMSISDLMGAFASQKKPYCLHSDWSVGYFVNLYNISGIRWDGPEAHLGWYPDTLQRNRIHPLGSQDSFIYRGAGGNCKMEGEKCNSTSLVCHYVNDTQMEKLWRKQNVEGIEK